MVPHRDLGLGFLGAGDGHVAHILDRHVALEAVDFGVDIHDDQPVRIDQRRHLDRHADLQLLDRRIPAISSAAVVAGGGIGPRFTHEQAGRLIMRSLDTGTLQDPGPAVRRRRRQRHIQVLTKTGQVTEPAGQAAGSVGRRTDERTL